MSKTRCSIVIILAIFFFTIEIRTKLLQEINFKKTCLNLIFKIVTKTSSFKSQEGLVGYVKSVFALVLFGEKRRSWSGWDGMDGKTYHP